MSGASAVVVDGTLCMLRAAGPAHQMSGFRRLAPKAPHPASVAVFTPERGVECVAIERATNS